jgi:hypothetical protein
MHSALPCWRIQDLGYKSTKANPDVWLRKATKDDGYEYYEMLFVYVDDILALSHHVKNAIEEILNSTRLWKRVSGHRRSIWAKTSPKYSSDHK